MKQALTTRTGLLPLLLLLIAIGLLLVSARPAAAQTGSLLIWPVDPVIASDARAAALWLENPGKAPITLQVRVYAWTQDGGDNAYAPQDAIWGTPPIVTIAPGGKQLVRLTRTLPTPAQTEQSFRVVVDEIPVSSPTAASGAAVAFRMRYSLPLFAYGEGLARPQNSDPRATSKLPQLAWRVQDGSGQRYLEIRNLGSTHARLTDVAFGDGASHSALAKGLLGYVLPGATMRWPLPTATVAGPELVAAINGGARKPLERLPD